MRRPRARPLRKNSPVLELGYVVLIAEINTLAIVAFFTFMVRFFSLRPMFYYRPMFSYILVIKISVAAMNV